MIDVCANISLILRNGQRLIPHLAGTQPDSQSNARYCYNRQKQPELFERHVRKMRSKTERQSALLADIGFNLSYLKGGVTSEYQHPLVFGSSNEK